MSDAKRGTDQEDDPELNELLNSALKDFDISPKPAIPEKEKEKDQEVIKSTSEENKSEENEEVTVEEVWTEDFIKQAADQFQRNFEELMQNGTGTEVGESFKKIAQSVAEAITENCDGENTSPNFQSAISQALKDLAETTDNLQNMPNISESDLAAMFGQTSLDEGGPDIFPFMQGMMQSLLSKEVLYTPLKDLVDRYPAWLNENKETLPPVDLIKYEKQLDLMRKVCSELETEKTDDTEEIKKKRFENTLVLMQDMQSCGQPPEDLIKAGDNPIAPALTGIENSQNCSVM